VSLEKTLLEKLESTEWRFAVAYIESKFNLAEAARKVFNVGGKGAKKKNLVSSASEMGRQTLNKLETQEYLMEILLDGAGESGGLLPTEAIQTLREMMLKKSTSESMRAAIAWEILRIRGVVKPQTQENAPQDHRHIHLVLPARKEV
jgi:hypothetical protein